MITVDYSVWICIKNGSYGPPVRGPQLEMYFLPSCFFFFYQKRKKEEEEKTPGQISCGNHLS